MTEFRAGERIERCQRCGAPEDGHSLECYSVARSSFDVSHSNLLEIDRLAGELLAEIMRFRSVEVIQNSSYAREYFALLDARRQG